MSTRHFPYPPDFEVDPAAARHEERRRRALRGCPETKALKNNILCHVLGKTKNGITGSAVSCHAFSKV
jgi:hypothetical protein